MKAATFRKYGPPEVICVAETEAPIPQANEVRVKIKFSTVTRSDTGVRSSELLFARVFTGLFRPRRNIIGMEFSGIVDKIGAEVSDFKVGDSVFGIASGTNAEYACVAQDGAIALKPIGITFEEAAATPDGALLALTCMKPSEWKGKEVLIYGASGSIGIGAVQLSKYFGANVTAVCNTKNVGLISSLGAIEVFDYLKEDFTKNGRKYDLIFDAVGKHSFWRSRNSLKSDARYVSADLGYMWHVPFFALLTKWFGKKKVRLGIGHYRQKDLLFIKDLLEQGSYRPVIDRAFPLSEVVQAHRYVETEQKTGSVTLVVDGSKI
jgi:NADPH:quinone reductase-like Zn-dependent oxidoreductase